MQRIKASIAVFFIIGLSAVALLSASEMATAATAKADALWQVNRTTIGAAVSSQIQQGLPADRQGAGISAVTEDPILKLAHCCHAHPLPPYDRYCCHPARYAAPVYVAPRAYVAPRYGVGAVGVRGVSRRTSRRTSRRVGRRR
jgi:hypothetical protein